MFIHVPGDLLKSQDYDACLRYACDHLTATGVNNYIYYSEPRTVEITDSGIQLSVRIDFLNAGINLF